MYRGTGYVIKGVGGLYTVELLPGKSAERAEAQPLDGQIVAARGRGNLRRDGELLVGDLVEIGYTDASFSVQQDGTCQPSADGTGVSIDRILPRRASLIRPPLANPDLLFVTFAAVSPAPDTGTVDKMLSIAAYNGIAAVIVITKTDRARKRRNGSQISIASPVTRFIRSAA